MAGEQPFDQLLLQDGLEPPLANGELVFEAPWQGRVFAMARSLAEQGHFSWDEFRAHLIEQIGAWDRSGGGADPAQHYRYFDHFLAALQQLLLSKGLLNSGALEERFRALAERPHGHDH